MKKLILILLILPLISFAQTIEVQFGDNYRDARKSRITKIIGQDDDGIYALRRKFALFSRYTPATIEYYDNELKLVYSKPIELPRKEMELAETFFFNDTLFAFIEYFDREKNINYLYGSYISREGKLDMNFAEIAAVQVDSKRSSNWYSVHNSTDSTRFLVTILPSYDKKAETEVHFKVIDHRYREFSDAHLEFPFEQRDFSFQTVILAANGDIHMMASVKPDEKSKRRRELRLFSYFKQNDVIHEYPILIGQNYITDYDMKVKPNNNVTIAGFYSDRGGASMKGVFSFEVNTSSRAIENIKTTDFTEEFLKQFFSARKAKKGKELWGYEVRDIFVKSDGAIQLLAEYYHFYITQTTNAQGQTTTTYHYVYGHVIVVDFNYDGEVNWWMKLPKMQHTTNDGGYYSGMSYHHVNDKIHLIYNDHPKNMNEVDPDRLRNMSKKKAWTVLVTIDKDGNTEKIPLFRAKDKRTLLVPKSGRMVSKNEQVFVSNIGKNYKLCRIKFN
jgi:hypothetical protein